MRLEQVRAKVTQAYEDYEFHLLYHTVHNFCAVDLSAIYLDILKDRVYTALPASTERRAAQTAMFEILNTLVAVVAPVLTFTSEEVWQYMPQEEGRPESVQLADWPQAKPEYLDAALEAKWDKILALRSEITKALETARRNKVIGHSLDAAVTLYAAGEELASLSAVKNDLATILIVSDAVLSDQFAQAPGDAYRAENMQLAVAVAPAHGVKCERCWIYSPTVNQDSEHPALCQRCATVVKNM